MMTGEAERARRWRGKPYNSLSDILEDVGRRFAFASEEFKCPWRCCSRLEAREGRGEEEDSVLM